MECPCGKKATTTVKVLIDGRFGRFRYCSSCAFDVIRYIEYAEVIEREKDA